METSRSYYIWFCLLGIAFASVSAIAYWRDEHREWKRHQREYLKHEEARAYTQEEKERLRRTPIEIKQVVVSDLDRVDRCTSCHITVDDPMYAQAEQPLTYHPNHDQHPFDKFGCTVCHGGQGRALTKAAAHGNVPHWEEPLLPLEYIQASCGKCHHPTDVPDAPDLAKGRALFEEKGCIGCHKLEGKGGNIGPDLSNVARAGHRDDQWLYEHFMDPQAVSAGSPMPKFNFTHDQAKSLTLYMLSLTGEKIGGYFASKKVIPNPDLGRRLFEEKNCIGCHRIGDIGRALGPDLVGVGTRRSPEWLIQHFRDPQSASPGTLMPQFGFTEDEAKALTLFVLSLDPQKIVGYLQIPTLLTPQERGKAVFKKYGCMGCHGKEGRGGIKNPNAQTAQEVPSLTYVAEGYTEKELKEKIIKGVPSVEKLNPDGPSPPLAMPSWQGKISPEELNDLVAYLMSLLPKEEEEEW